MGNEDREELERLRAEVAEYEKQKSLDKANQLDLLRRELRDIKVLLRGRPDDKDDEGLRGDVNAASSFRVKFKQVWAPKIEANSELRKRILWLWSAVGVLGAGNVAGVVAWLAG